MAVVGMSAGIALQHVLRLEIRGNMYLSLVGSVGALIFCGVFAVRCPQVNFAGVTTQYLHPNSHISRSNLNAHCNDHCQCEPSFLDLHCHKPPKDAKDRDPIMYFSKCYAGCEATKGTVSLSGKFVYLS